MIWVELGGVAVALVVGVVGLFQAARAKREAAAATAAAVEANALAESANALARDANAIAEKGYAFASALRWTISVLPFPEADPDGSPINAQPVVWQLAAVGSYDPVDVAIRFSHDPHAMSVSPTKWARIRANGDGVIIDAKREVWDFPVAHLVDATVTWGDPTGEVHTQVIEHVPLYP